MSPGIWRAAAALLLAAAAGVALALWLAPFTVDPAPGFHPGAVTPSITPLEPAPASLAGLRGACKAGRIACLRAHGSVRCSASLTA